MKAGWLMTGDSLPFCRLVSPKGTESPVAAALIAAAAFGLVGYAAVAGGDAWNDYFRLFDTSRFIHVMTIDFLTLSALAPFWVYNDATARQWADRWAPFSLGCPDPSPPELLFAFAVLSCSDATARQWAPLFSRLPCPASLPPLSLRLKPYFRPRRLGLQRRERWAPLSPRYPGGPVMPCPLSRFSTED